MDNLLSLIAPFPYIGLFVLPVIGSLGFPLPEDGILLLCGMLISRNMAEPTPALLAVYMGILISDYLIFAVGRRYGQQIVSHKIFRRLISAEQLVTFETRFRKSGNLLILFGRQIFWLRAKIFLVAGIMKMPVRSFLLMDAVASLLTVAFMVTAGHQGSRLLAYFDWLKPEWQGIAAITAIPIVILLLVMRNRSKQRLPEPGITPEGSNA